MNRTREEWIKRQECYGLDEFEQRKVLYDWQESDEKKDAEIADQKTEILRLNLVINSLYPRREEIEALKTSIAELKKMLSKFIPVAEPLEGNHIMQVLLKNYLPVGVSDPQK